MSIKHHKLSINQAYFAASITGLSVAGLCLLILPDNILLAILLAVVGSAIVFYIIQQQQQVKKLQAEIESHQVKEETFLHHAKDLHAVLHDLRNSMGSVKLSIQVLQRVSCEDDQRYLNRMEESLETALDQLVLIADMHKEES